MPISAKAELDKIIDESTQYLMSNWLEDKALSRKHYPPQVVSIPEGTKVYGGCGKYMVGDDVGGSSYCPPTHTIFLVPEELKLFNDAFGPSSVTYVIAHEISRTR